MELQEAFDAGFEAVKAYVDEALAEFETRLRAFEARPLAQNGVGIVGAIKNADGILVLTYSDGRTIETGIRDGAPGKDGSDGRDAAPVVLDDLRPVIKAEVATEVAQIEQTASDLVERAVAAVVEKVTPPELPDVAAMVHEAVKAIPAAPAGRDADMAEVERIIKTTVAAEIAKQPKPKDGIGVAGAVITREGALTLTLSDGTTRDLGIVVGNDGQPGRDGEPGKPGRDGIDGLGFDDLAFESGDDGVFLIFARGEAKKSFRLPVVIDRGVFKEGNGYHAGDGVTWGGSYWIAQRDAKSKPDAGNGDWRLAVKKGRDGKDAKAA